MISGANHKGAIAEAVVCAEAIKLGLTVLRPTAEHNRYDLALDLGHRILRVQCKWAALERGELVRVRTGGIRHTPAGYVRTTYALHEIDAVAAYCADLDRCYLLPAELIAGRHLISLRLEPPRNGQRAALHWAADYELSGAIAQLGERRLGMAEVAGSSPAGSTERDTALPAAAEIGAHEFRERFGYHLERVAAGTELMITRHGRPYARLAPAQDRGR